MTTRHPATSRQALPLVGVSILCLGLLAACGGGSSDNDPSPNSATPPPTVNAPETAITGFPLNDTSITQGGNYPEGNNANCIGETISAQDCSHGRDNSHNDDNDGATGFSFVKLDSTGQPLPDSATQWSCVKDQVTGLIWEVKTQPDGTVGNAGLHDGDDSYRWYSTDSSHNAGASGYDAADFNYCFGYQAGNPASYCNTQAFVARVNAEGYCGRSDWHLPNRRELRSIVHHGRAYPAIDTDYFPHIAYNHYWLNAPVAENAGENWKWARSIDFRTGTSGNKERYTNLPVRLVAAP